MVGLGAVVTSCFVVFAPPGQPTAVYPHYLAYFNELAGGPRNGYQSLVDSNLDWGQDLKELRRPTVLAVPSYIAISATHLQRVRLGARTHESWRRIWEDAVLVDTVGYSIFIYRLPPASR